jgi:acetyl-CoA acetyltransferase
MRESGVTKEHLARVVVKNRANGARNPNAMYQTPTTADAVLGSRLVCEPLHLHMLCSPNEGAAAVVLQKARPGDGAVRIAAAALRSHLPGSVLGEATPMSGIDDTGIDPPSTLAADAAYAEAGLGPADLHVVEGQDTDAARELLGYEELRLCPRGGSAELVERGDTEPGGRLPVNPSGGLLAKGEPLGASALGQVVEITQQLRGTAGPRQVDGARVGLAHTVGRGANAAVIICTR